MPRCERLWQPDEHQYRVEVPGLFPSLNEAKKTHWGTLARQTKRMRRDAALAAKQHVITRNQQPLAAARIDILLIRTSRSQPRDRDNALSSVKAAVDGVVDAGLIRDDGPLYVEYGSIEQQIGPAEMTILTLTEIQPRLG